MRTIVVANQKGGCAKTTTVVNLAAALAEIGKKILVIDLDPQANATQWLSGDGSKGGAYGLMIEEGPIDNFIGNTSIENVKIICATQELSYLERALAGRVASDSILSRRISCLKEDDWDFVLIETYQQIAPLIQSARK